MKICLIGNCTGNIDEGMKNIIFNLHKGLSEHNDVLLLNPLEAFSLKFWMTLRCFDPQIVHYIPGPSIKSFLLMRLIKIFCGVNTKCIMSAVLPKLSIFSKEAMRLFKPDLMIIQSQNNKNIFTNRGFQTRIAPLSGINLNKFFPVDKDRKYNLRRKYDINSDDFVILHVGHIKPGRNIGICKDIASKCDNTRIIVIGSTSTTIDKILLSELLNNGVTVYSNYFEHIEEIYQLSDCYVFPTEDELNSIMLPLSVLEAMACNLIIISTKFGLLQEYFIEGGGLIFVETKDQIISELDMLNRQSIKVSTREKMNKFSWETIVDNVEKIYHDFTSGESYE